MDASSQRRVAVLYAIFLVSGFCGLIYESIWSHYLKLLLGHAAYAQAVLDHRAELEGKTIVSFCTGGIRCEKAAIYMHDLGLTNVLQLEGGILKYFEEAGSAHFVGECFVFDERRALTAELLPAPA